MRVPSPNAIALTGTESSWLSVSFSGAGGAGGAGGAALGPAETELKGPDEALLRGLGAALATAGACSMAGARCTGAQPMNHRHEPQTRPGFIARGEPSSDRGSDGSPRELRSRTAIWRASSARHSELRR